MTAATPAGSVARWLPVALAAALALLELACMGGMYCADTTTFLSHTHAAGTQVRFNVVNPGLPLLLDALIALLPAGGRMVALVIVQQLALVALPWFVVRCGELLGKPRAGVVAALLTALYAPLSLWAHVALSDALFAVLFTATAWAFCRALVVEKKSAWLVAGALAAAAMAWRSSGVALVAAAAVALLCTASRAPNRTNSLRAQLRGLVFFGAGFTAAFLGVLAKNRVQHGDWKLVQGGGIHFFCRVATLDRVLPDTPESRELTTLAQQHGHASPLYEQSGWELHDQLVSERGLSPRAADDLLATAAWQALAADPWRTARLTWDSMASACGCADATNYVLSGALRPAAFVAAEEDARLRGGHRDDHFQRMRALLPSFPPRAAQDDPLYGFIERWSKLSRAWCGAWLLYALLVFGALGLWRRDAALVFLTGAAFAQLAASALGDTPWVGHFDPAAPLLLLAAALAAVPLFGGKRTTTRVPGAAS